MSFQFGGLNYYRPFPQDLAETIHNSQSAFLHSVPRRWLKGGAFLACADFALHRTSKGEQPFVSQGDVITFDGRLDNRNDLRLFLGDRLRGNVGDAELALTIWRIYGVGGLVRLIGDFSLAIYDAEHQQVVLASDAMGVRPLYYHPRSDGIHWSTSLKWLLDCTNSADLDEHYVAGFLLRGGCPGRTPYRGVYSVPPGQAVVASGDGVHVHRFWRPPVEISIRYQANSDYEEHLRELFGTAVRSRLDTDFPVLSHLSGGLDSSSTVCMASHLIRSGMARPPRFVTLSYQRRGSLDERFYQIVGKWCGFESLLLSTSELRYIAEDHTGGALPAYWEELDNGTADLVRQIGARTVLTGSMGDLVMANVSDDSSQIADQIRARRFLASAKAGLDWSMALRVPIWGVLWRAARATLPVSWVESRDDLYCEGIRGGVHREDSLTPAFRACTEGDNFFGTDWMRARPSRRKHIRALTQYLELRRLQPAEPLAEFYYTHPFAHRPMVEFMMSIPPGVACGPGKPRRLMRRAFRHLWPPELRGRQSKDSFDDTFIRALRPLLPSLLESVGTLQVVKRGIVEPVSLRGRLEKLGGALECNIEQLRRVILLELWLRRTRLAIR